jgi:hypothetical protein
MPIDSFGNQIPANPMTPDIYWAAQHHIVTSTMQKVMGSPDAWAAGIKLSIAGYPIDKATMIYGWNPVLVMSMRASLGLKFVQTIAAEALPGRIKVSMDAADYPPADPPPAAPNVTDMVGTIEIPGEPGQPPTIVPNLLWTVNQKSYFAPGPGCYDAHGIKADINGKKFIQDGIEYTAEVHSGDEMMGFARVFMTTGG